jgi:hypothetical protein
MHVQAKDNQPLTLSGLTGRTGAKEVLISGNPSKINLIDCQAISVQPATERVKVAGVGGGTQSPLVNITRCFDVELSRFDLLGQVNLSSKEAFKNTVPCGVMTDLDSNGVKIREMTGVYLHYGITGRCVNFELDGAELELCSGDFVRVCRDGFRVANVMAAYSLAVWDYAELHRDGLQLWQLDKSKTFDGVPVLSNGLIENCVFFLPDVDSPTIAEINPWIATADGIMGTDGAFKNISMRGCEVYSNNQNGIRFGPMINCEIDPATKTQSARGKAWRKSQ